MSMDYLNLMFFYKVNQKKGLEYQQLT